MLEYIPAASFVLTGVVMIWKMGGVASRLDLLLTLLTERVNDIDTRLANVEKNQPLPPIKKSRKPALFVIRKPR